MKVFAITANGSYCTGTAVVAAKNEQDAVECAAKNIHNKTFFVRWDKPYIVELLQDVSSKVKVPTVLYHHETGE